MNDSNTVLILLDIPPEFIPQAQYVCGFLSDAWGLRVETTQDTSKRSAAHIVYSSAEQAMRCDTSVVIPFDALLYDPATPCCAATVDGRLVWAKKGASVDAVDLIAATFRLLTLAGEQQIRSAARDNLGNFHCTDLPEGRRGTLDIPLADYHAQLLLEKLFCVSPQLIDKVAPRWPEGKKYVVCLTHDTDCVHTGHPLEICTNLTKWLLRRKRVFLDMVLDGLKHLNAPMKSHFWGFDGWREYESACNIRSCFYLPVLPRKCWRRLNDCKSDVFAAGVDWKVFKGMAEQGWEFGLHSALNSKDDLEEFVLEKHAIEESLGASINGLRHHYLAIDNLHPSLTFRKHVDAGFLYDSSLGWQEKAGFRAGTTLPLQPYDSILKAPLELIEIPLNLMDTYIMSGDPANAVKEANTIVSTARDIGGVITLNWHTETYCNQYLYLNYRSVLQKILEPLIFDDTVWFATPLEIAQWWRSRSEALR